jgi:hypothetical protein
MTALARALAASPPAPWEPFPWDLPSFIERMRYGPHAAPCKRARGWACPSGHAAVVVLTSRAGRVYAACSVCHSFQS